VSSEHDLSSSLPGTAICRAASFQSNITEHVHVTSKSGLVNKEVNRSTVSEITQHWTVLNTSSSN